MNQPLVVTSQDGLHLPAIIDGAGERARRRFIEFFVAEIRNPNTRKAYARAVGRFCHWCDDRDLDLQDIEPAHVAAYVETHPASVATVKQHLAALRMLFNYLVVGQVIPVNPALSVRGPRLVAVEGQTPVLTAGETAQLLAAIDTNRISGLRDRALIGVMVFSFARVSAVIGMLVEDYYAVGKRWKFRFREKGGKKRVLPVHPQAEEYLDGYLEAAGIGEEKKTPLFRSINQRRQLTDRSMHRTDVLQMVKRRARQAGLPDNICCHSFRGTGITTYLQNGGTLEVAQYLAGHASAKTTKIYDRRRQHVGLEEIVKIRI